MQLPPLLMRNQGSQRNTSDVCSRHLMTTLDLSLCVEHLPWKQYPTMGQKLSSVRSNNCYWPMRRQHPITGQQILILSMQSLQPPLSPLWLQVAAFPWSPSTWLDPRLLKISLLKSKHAFASWPLARVSCNL